MGLRLSLKKLIGGGVLAASALLPLQAGAVLTTVGGVTWDPDSILDFSSFSIAVRQTIDPVTGVISGFGIVSTINGTAQSAFCPGCELTFTFNGFTPVGSNPIPSTLNSTVLYTGGFFNFYVDTTPEITNPADPLSLTNANASDGTLWLGLLARPSPIGGITLTETVTPGTLSGQGFLDVVGGLAMTSFNTNTQTGGADFSFTNSYSLFFPRGNLLDAAGTGNFFSDSITNDVPEPMPLALLGVGALGLIGAARRRRA